MLLGSTFAKVGMFADSGVNMMLLKRLRGNLLKLISDKKSTIVQKINFIDFLLQIYLVEKILIFSASREIKMKIHHLKRLEKR